MGRTASRSAEAVAFVAGVLPVYPSAPLYLGVTAGTSLVLNWVAPSSSGTDPITEYEIYKGSTRGGETPLTTISAMVTAAPVGTQTPADASLAVAALIKATPVGSVITAVGCLAGTHSGGTSLAFTTSNVGDCVLLGVGNTGDLTLSSVSDTSSRMTWTVLGNYYNATIGFNGCLALGVVTSVGSTTIDLTLSSGTAGEIIAQEFHRF